VEMHDHPSLTHPGFRFEIAYVKNGEALAFTQTSSFPVKAGDYVMIDASLHHGYKVLSESPFHLINIFITQRHSIHQIRPIIFV
jgi:quercetin dioxygenase-like cupin family protein